MTLVQECVARYREFFTELGKGNISYLEEILAPEFFSVDPVGLRRDKPAYIAFCAREYSEALIVEFTTPQAHEPVQGAVVFDSAARMGPHPLGPPEDPFIYFRMLSVWAHRDVGWRYVATQGTSMTPPAA